MLPPDKWRTTITLDRAAAWRRTHGRPLTHCSSEIRCTSLPLFPPSVKVHKVSLQCRRSPVIPGMGQKQSKKRELNNQCLGLLQCLQQMEKLEALAQEDARGQPTDHKRCQLPDALSQHNLLGKTHRLTCVTGLCFSRCCLAASPSKTCDHVCKQSAR